MSRRRGETSYHDTAFGILPRSKLIPLEVEGIARAWDALLRERAHRTILITTAAIRRWHRVGFGWIFPDVGGHFRTVDVAVSRHEPPRYFRVPEHMRNFCDDLAERLRHLPPVDDPALLNALIALLAWAHHRFLWIHPFRDYNGRIGRLLMNAILLNLDLPPIELSVTSRTNRTRYIRALQRADDGNDRDLQALIREAFEESGKHLQRLQRGTTT